MVVLLCLSASVLVSGQKPMYAGKRGQGYKDALLANPVAGIDRIDEIKSNSIQAEVVATTENAEKITKTTSKLPIDANGDKNYLETVNKHKKDQQPFWLLNQKAIQDFRSTIHSVLNNRVMNQKGYYLGLGLNRIRPVKRNNL